MLMASLLMALGASKQNLCHKGDETQLANIAQEAGEEGGRERSYEQKKEEEERELNEKFLKEAMEGNAEAVTELLQDSRVDVTHEDKIGNNALVLASRKGHVGVVEALLRDGRIDPTARGNRAVEEAAW